MTQTEIRERNKEIALMLGWIYVTWQDVKNEKFNNHIKRGWYSVIPKHYHEILHGRIHKSENNNNLKFHLDWNWIMKAVYFIEEQDIGSSEFAVTINRFGCEISTVGYRRYTAIDKEQDKLEVVFIAVSDFAKKFNQKEL